MSLEPGQVTTLSPLVRRLVAPNPGMMTGAGTNCYLIGNDQIAVVDPGPDDEGHIETIVSVCGDRIHSIIVTHTHRDHSPAAARLAERVGATVVGAPPPEDAFQDRSFVPDTQVSDGQLMSCGEWSLRAVHTPGHVGNHYCFLLEDEGLLMAGDHIMNGSTVVIIPPSGDMAAYIRSLKKLLDYPLQMLAPGHGELIDNPRDEIAWIVEHRIQRENKVVDKLALTGRTDLKELVTKVYDDVNSALHPMARMSLWAHLLKLEEDGRVSSDGQFWELS